MAYLLQVDFPFEGPFCEEMEKAFWDLAKSINEEDGFHWKIWMENEEMKDAEKYADMHKNRLQASGIKDIRVRIFHINDKLTKLNHGYSK